MKYGNCFENLQMYLYMYMYTLCMYICVYMHLFTFVVSVLKYYILILVTYFQLLYLLQPNYILEYLLQNTTMTIVLLFWLLFCYISFVLYCLVSSFSFLCNLILSCLFVFVSQRQYFIISGNLTYKLCFFRFPPQYTAFTISPIRLSFGRGKCFIYLFYTNYDIVFILLCYVIDLFCIQKPCFMILQLLWK